MSFLTHLTIDGGVEHIVFGLKAADTAVMLGNTFDGLSTEAKPLMFGRKEFAVICTFEGSGEGIVYCDTE